MPGWFVAVELPSRDTTQPESAALIAACSSALGAGRCRLAETSAEPPQAVAVVSFRDPARLAALIEVGRRESASVTWRTEEMAFKAEDAPIQRFRTLGLAIATLVRESEFMAAAPASDAPERSPKGAPRNATEHSARADTKGVNEPRNAAAAPAPAPHSGHSPLGWVGAGALLSYDHELPSSFRYGGRIEIGSAPRKIPIYASVHGSYAVGRAPGDGESIDHLSLAWTTLGVGGGGRVPLPLEFEGRLGVHATVVDLVAHASQGGSAEQEGRRWIFGGQVELEIAGLRSRPIGFSAGGGLQHLSGGTQLVLHEQPVATTAAFGWFVHFSLEVRPFR